MKLKLITLAVSAMLLSANASAHLVGLDDGVYDSTTKTIIAFESETKGISFSDARYRSTGWDVMRKTDVENILSGLDDNTQLISMMGSTNGTLRGYVYGPTWLVDTLSLTATSHETVEKNLSYSTSDENTFTFLSRSPDGELQHYQQVMDSILNDLNSFDYNLAKAENELVVINAERAKIAVNISAIETSISNANMELLDVKAQKANIQSQMMSLYNDYDMIKAGTYTGNSTENDILSAIMDTDQAYSIITDAEGELQSKLGALQDELASLINKDMMYKDDFLRFTKEVETSGERKASLDEDYLAAQSGYQTALTEYTSFQSFVQTEIDKIENGTADVSAPLAGALALSVFGAAGVARRKTKQ